MRIIKLTKQMVGYFLDMDPLMLVERLEFPGYAGLAAVDTDPATGDDIPAGLLIYSTQHTSIVIEWMFVKTEYRNRGIGEQFIRFMFELASKKNMSRVCAYFNQVFGRELICNNEENYFRERMFEQEEYLSGEWFTDLRTLSKQPFFDKKPGDGSFSALPLRRIVSTELKPALDMLAESEHSIMLYPIEDRKHFFDADVSWLLHDKKRLRGGILVQCVPMDYADIINDKVEVVNRNVLYLVLFNAESEVDARILIYHAMESALEKYPKDTDIHIVIRSNVYKGLMERIFPGQSTQNKVLVASVKEYEKYKQDKAYYEALLSE